MTLDEIDFENGYLLGEDTEADHKGVVLVCDSFQPDSARDLVSEYADCEERVYVYDRTQVGIDGRIGFFGDWAPTVIAGLNSYQGFHLPYREKFIEEYSYSRLAHLMCTLDRSIMFGYQNRHIASSKIRNLNACAKGLLYPEYGIDYGIMRGVVEERMESKDLIFMVKQHALELARKVRMADHDHITKRQEPHGFAYVDKLKEMFGANLKTVVLYGSSAVGEGKDYDNIVVLKEVPQNLYDIIRDKGPWFNEGGKDVGFIFISEDVVEKFFYVNVSNHLFQESSKVLLGEITLPVETDDYMVRKERYHAGFGSTKNISGLNMGWKDEDLMTYIFYQELGIERPFPQPDRQKKYLLAAPDKAGLYEYFAKLPRFTLQGLRFQKGMRDIDKAHLLAILKEEFGYEMLPHKQDHDYIAERLLAAVESSARIIEKYYDPTQQHIKNEHILTIEDVVSPQISTATLDGKTVWVFNRRRPLLPGDNVPAQLLNEGDRGFDFRMRKALQLGKPEDAGIAKRL